MATDQPLAKAAMLCLGEAWPRALSFADLLRAARSLVTSEPRESTSDPDQDTVPLCEILLATYAAGLIEVHLCPPTFLAEPSSAPVASAVARLQLKIHNIVTTLRHTSIAVEDELGRQLLLRLDGTRDRAVLLAELNELFASGAVTLPKKGQLPQQSADIGAQRLARKLEELGRLALLIA